MSDVVIRVDQLAKRYQIGAARERYVALRDVVSRKMKRIGRLLSRRNNEEHRGTEGFWALSDVSFEVKKGECVGIIGRNGAGKSTLLKILSRIVEPTKGEARLRGRTSSLLEVGTGFHPELTGRENIFLNGAILGMRRSEILRKFDEIVAFAEVEKFLDTPVKFYSSGMYMRLAFAVAAHMEPDILVIDEVLAVGDAQFQKKCLGKMKDVAQGGRTILFVSHNMAAITQLTNRCMFFRMGRLIYAGVPQDAIARYLDSHVAAGNEQNVENLTRQYSHLQQEVQFVRVKVNHVNGLVGSDEPIRLIFEVRTNADVRQFRLSATLFRMDGVAVGSWFSHNLGELEKGEKAVYEVRIQGHSLAPGKYYFGAATGRGDPQTGHHDYDIIMDVLHFDVCPAKGDAGTVSHWTPGWGAIVFASPIITRADKYE